jgi:cytochrome c oxidase subunit II
VTTKARRGPTPAAACGTVAVVRPTPGPRRLRALAAALAVALAGCDLPSFGAPDPKSEQGERIYSLWQGFFLAGLAVGLLVWGLLIYVLIRYRRRGDDDEVPDQRAFHIPLEITYTAIPVAVVAVLFGVSWVTVERVNELEPDPATVVKVVGFQWSWQFVYEDEQVTITGEPGEPPELVLPVGERARLELVATDVAHSFWTPDFLSKRDLIPGVDNEIEVTPTETGSYVGRCAEFCGLDHWRMYYSVRVVSPDDYEAWLDEQRQAQEATS